MKRTLVPLALLCGALSFLPYKASAQIQESKYLLPASAESYSSDSTSNKKYLEKRLEKIIAERNMPVEYNSGWPLTYSLSTDDKRAGTLRIDNEKNNSLELKIDAPIPHLTAFLNFIFKGLIDPRIKKDVFFSKQNDSTYIELVDDEFFDYRLRGNRWTLVKYFGKREEKENLVGKKLSGSPLLNIITKKLSGENIDSVYVFILGLDYKGRVRDNQEIKDYEGLIFDPYDFGMLQDNGEWKSLVEDEDALLEDMIAVFKEGEFVFGIGNIRKGFFLPTTIEARRK